MAVIAMARELATRGSEVAIGIADRLGLQIVHHEVVEHDIAGRTHLPESEVHRYLEGEASLWERWKIDPKRMSRFTSLEILELAAAGNVVIRGWGATALLGSIPHVVTVRTCAPMAYREQVMMDRVALMDRAAAQQEIVRNDACHSGMMKRMFDTDWQHADHYAITLNTARVPVSECVEQIVRLVEGPAFQETEQSRGLLHDALVLARVNARLEEEFGNRSRRHGFEIKVEGGHVSLHGATTDTDLIVKAVRALQDVEGVASVESRISVVEFIPPPVS